ncbi:zinc-binding dehydrogenase [Clostridium cuniculi]|uniref:zinc-binding dehydrogenase n=1 Tax=Clostridium cuniculi TaxID=2548455 RepID=UPI0018A9A77B|nr:zinc-binding dehydrogenase [Clostridium cuniculi]
MEVKNENKYSSTRKKEITRIVEENNIVPSIDSRIFTIEEAGEALKLVANGHTNGKVIIKF